jgi:hypothetical protein
MMERKYMLIQCTKALLDKIGIKQSELASSEGHENFPDSFMAWHANFVIILFKPFLIGKTTTYMNL